MTSLATLFHGILATLRAGLAAQAAWDHPRTALLCLAWARVGRMSVRLANLFARWHAGTLPTPRASRAGKPTPFRERPRMPTGRQWLIKTAREPSAAAASQLQHWMTHPDFLPFLAAAPQARRILRPLCRMLGIEQTPDVPSELKLPRPPAFRPAPPQPPPARGIEDPPEAVPLHTMLPRGRAFRPWYA